MYTATTMSLQNEKKNALQDRRHPLRPNSDLSQTSHCNNKGLSVRKVMRIENMIIQVKFC